MIRPAGSLRFRPDDRVRRKADFDLAYGTGERVPSRSFTLIVRPNGLDRPRLGVTLSRTVGNAVVRNAVRRRLREAFRRNREAIPHVMDIIVHVRPAAAGRGYAELEAELLQALGRWASRRGRKP